MGKDELIVVAQKAFTKSSGISIPTLAMSFAQIFIPLFSLAPANFTAKYLKENLQQIFKNILEAGLLSLLPTFQPFVFPNSSCERPLQVRFPDLYCSKIYMKYYNFYQKCKDYFANVEAKKHNQVFFAATFFQDQALFW